MRTIKQDIKLLNDIKQALTDEYGLDMDAETHKFLLELVFVNQNKWLMSDKISSEKQGRMDQYKKEKGSGTPGGEENPPTEKQIALCKYHKIDITGKTKSQVSDLIDADKKAHPEDYPDWK
jgi:hypothetical protein